jgi:hypothetical protein
LAPLKFPVCSSTSSRTTSVPGLAYLQIEYPFGVDHRYRCAAESISDGVLHIVCTGTRTGFNDGLDCRGKVCAVVGECWCAGTDLGSARGSVGVNTEIVVEAPAAQPIAHFCQLRKLAGVGEFG